jgi:hypothetical protein
MITDYASLQTALANLLGRGDLTSHIPGFIQDLEAELKDDERVRKHADRGTLNVSGDGVLLPTDMMELESWYHDNDTYRGAIETVGVDAIPQLKQQYGATGVPLYAAIVDGRARFAPTPDATYATKMTYWRTITALSDANTTNWLLLDRPDIYKYGAARFSAPFLKEDERLPTWDALYQRALDQLSDATQRAQFGGPLRRQVTPIG